MRVRNFVDLELERSWVHSGQKSEAVMLSVSISEVPCELDRSYIISLNPQGNS